MVACPFLEPVSVEWHGGSRNAVLVHPFRRKASCKWNAPALADDDIPDFDKLPEDRARQRAVPSGRIARFGTFGRLVGGVAGGMMAEGARRLASGEGISTRDLIMTPGNVQRLTDRLSHLRGAAMKMGQMISLDAGDFLPDELSRILATLRDQANFMPTKQLDAVLRAEWGADWRKQFRWFNPRPIAAASIGQVHKALTRDGENWRSRCSIRVSPKASTVMSITSSHC